MRNRWRWRGSAHFWERQYQAGGWSGAGSYNELATFKAEIINAFISSNNIQRAIELGCGDGNQLSLIDYPEYLGFDVSETALEKCRSRFSDDNTRSFKLMEHYAGETADLSLSLDVIYHLIEDPVYDQYMETLFDSSTRFVIVYSSNKKGQQEKMHLAVRHRQFTNWVDQNRPGWHLRDKIPNRYPIERYPYPKGSFSDFYIFENVG